MRHQPPLRVEQRAGEVAPLLDAIRGIGGEKSCATVIGMLALLSTLSGLCLSQLVGGGWETVYEFDGPPTGGWLGWSVAGPGDVNGDGFDDILLGAREAAFGNLSCGLAYVHSGADGSLLHLFHGEAPNDYFGSHVAAAGDVNADGFADVVIVAARADPQGRYDAGSAFVYSGIDGALLHRFDGAFPADYLERASGAGDVDGDGFDDLIVGLEAAESGGFTDAGLVEVRSGATGALLYQFAGTAHQYRLGADLGSPGDVNGDGFADLMYSAINNLGGQPYAGVVFVRSGADGSLLMELRGEHAADYFGISIAAAGDVDADGRPDLAIGAPGFGPSGRTAAGAAYAISGRTGLVLHRWEGQDASDQLGWDVDGAGDLNRDGFADVIAGAPSDDPGGRPGAGSAILFSGRDGRALALLEGPANYSSFGYSVAGSGDLDGDGYEVVTVGAPYTPQATQAGYARVHGFNPMLVPSAESLSVAAGGIVRYEMDFPDSDAWNRFQILVSRTGTGPTIARGLEIPLTRDGAFRRSASGSYPSFAIGFSGVLGADGDASAMIAAPPGALAGSLIGSTLYLAAVSITPLGQPLRSSVARELRFLP